MPLAPRPSKCPLPRGPQHGDIPTGIIQVLGSLVRCRFPDPSPATPGGRVWVGPGRGQLSHSSPTPFAPVVSLKNRLGAHAAPQAGGLRITRVGTLDTRSYLQTPECAAKIQNCYLSCSTSFPAPESTDTVITPAPRPPSPPYFWGPSSLPQW